MLRNTPDTYGTIHKIIHWTTALIVFALLSVGFYMVELPFESGKLQVYLLHKSFGLLVLFLAVLRIGWRLSNAVPSDLPTHRTWEKKLANLTHFLMYAALIVMPLSGWLMSSAGDFPAPFFGLFEMPDFIPKNENLFNALREFHEIFAFVILGVVGLHGAGAFKHHFIDRDETLQRMTSRKTGFVAGGVLALAAGALFILPLGINLAGELKPEPQAPAGIEQAANAAAGEANGFEKSAHPDQWVIKPEASSIGFEATQYGETFSGQFASYAATIVFNPEHLETAKAVVAIDIASIKTGSDDRDAQARAPDWFDANQHPQAVFETESFARTGANQYVAKGNLAIRGVKLPVELPFTLDIADDAQGKTAQMRAELVLNRLDFGIGQGQWQSAETIGNSVKITLRVEAWQNLAWAQ
jgi:cytochrome b561/polyisoprenoid-binding protein YceI